MPRPYRLGARAAQMQATRDRIVEAAIELYTEQGISRTTLRQVGERADVAPGTLRNHFASRADLERAMVERLTAEAPLPDAWILDGAQSIGERIERLMLATGRFLDRASRLYRMWLREPMLTGPWSVAGQSYGTRWAELTRIALGPLAADEEATALVQAISQPAFFQGIRAGRRSTDEAARLISHVVAGWFEARLAAVEQEVPTAESAGER
jgi:AcrR family transcriptional regulator